MKGCLGKPARDQALKSEEEDTKQGYALSSQHLQTLAFCWFSQFSPFPVDIRAQKDNMNHQNEQIMDLEEFKMRKRVRPRKEAPS